MSSETIELLAPAGNAACLHAAIRAGADAVYLGAGEFNARRGADNFSLDGLAEACDYVHMRGRRLYLTVNTAVLPEETNAALELIRQAYRRGVDAFIVQDIGIATEMKRTLPDACLHVSTQMNTHNESGLHAAARLGAKRVTLARELSLDEVAHLCGIAEEEGLEVEVFAHGALCICYSGQCLMSSLIGGRSANRGMCAQACRLPYELHNRAVRKNLAAPGEHLLSPKDLCTIDLLPQLVACGVSSLKIEGRMKSPEYVSAVTRVYRQVLDRVLAWRAESDGSSEPPASVRATDEEHRELSEAFSRGFTTAYLTGDTDGDMMSYARPNNRGVFVGRVSSFRDGVVSVGCTEDLSLGDIVEFWTNDGHFTHTVHSFEQGDGRTVRMAIEKRVGQGDRVFRVRNAVAAYRDDEFEPKIRLTASVRLAKGEVASLTLRAPDGTQVETTGDMVEAARTKAVSADEVRQHIDRFGGTAFSLGQLDVQVDEGVGIGFSQLHKLRSRAGENMENQLLAPYRSRNLPRISAAPKMERPARTACSVAVWVTNPACARAAKKAGADVLYVPALNFKRGESSVAGQLSATVAQTGYPKRTCIALPIVDHDPVGSSREAVFGFDAWERVHSGETVLAENFGQIERAKALGAEVEAGPHIPALNPLALEALREAGVSRVWLSPELSFNQICRLGESTPVPLGVVAMGFSELMVTEHCLLSSQGPCNQNCTSCARRRSPHYLKDRKGYEMTVITDCCGRSHLYNAVSLDTAHLAYDLIAAGVSAFMVDSSLMNVEQTSIAVARMVRARDIALKSGDHVSKMPDATTGHMFRGVS
jgi:putative protease